MLVALGGAILWLAMTRMDAAVQRDELHRGVVSDITELRFALVDYLALGVARGEPHLRAAISKLADRLVALPETEAKRDLAAHLGANHRSLEPLFARLLQLDAQIDESAGNGRLLRQERDRLVSQLTARTRDMVLDARHLNELSHGQRVAPRGSGRREHSSPSAELARSDDRPARSDRSRGSAPESRAKSGFSHPGRIARGPAACDRLPQASDETCR